MGFGRSPCEANGGAPLERTMGCGEDDGLRRSGAKLIWGKVFLVSVLHVGAFYGIFLILTETLAATTIYAFAYGFMTNLGIYAGSHRLWSHRSYKAKLPLRIFLGLMQTAGGQFSILEWCRNHRIHHKYAETDADPHNAARGFFYSHIGWALCEEHPEFVKKRKTIDVNDLIADPVVKFQYRYYTPAVILLCFTLPGLVPLYWNETVRSSLFVCIFFRYAMFINMTFTINSLAHMWGQKPYDKAQGARENFLVNLYLGGEGTHNFHHAFPYDYWCSEHSLNTTGFFIDCMAALGQVCDRKLASPEIVQRRKERCGDREELTYS